MVEDNTPKPMFYLTPQQLVIAGNWMKSHDAEKHIPPGKKFRYTGASGGAYTWRFTPTTLGTVSTVHCSCGEKVDLTDYDAW